MGKKENVMNMNVSFTVKFNVLLFSVYFVILFIVAILHTYYREVYEIYIVSDVIGLLLLVCSVIYYVYILFLTIISKLRQFKQDKDKEKENADIYKNEWCCIHIPYYSEDVKTIENSLDSVVQSNYHNKVIMITVDGQSNTDIFKVLNNVEYNLRYEKGMYLGDIQLYTGFYKEVPYVLLHKNKQIGKRKLQQIIFKLISWSRGQDTDQDSFNEILYRKMLKLGVNLQEIKYLCLVDGDTSVENTSIKKLIRYLRQNDNYIGVCGETQVKRENTYNLLEILQIVEYNLIHKFIKLLENSLGDVLVLSGCFSIYKIENTNDELVIDNDIISQYTSGTKQDTHFKNLLDIGEDRHLTTLLLLKNKGQLKYLETAKCETLCPNTFYSLLVQRRRWTNSMIHCLIELIKKSKKKGLTILAIVELIIVMMMPLGYALGLYYVISGMINNNAVVYFTILLFNVIPFVVIVMSLGYKVIWKYFLFLLFQFVFMVMIPIYSFINQNDTAW